MNILAISHEFPPIGGGGANAAYYLIKGFVEKGHQVTLITSNYNNLPKQEQINGATVIRVSSKRNYKEHCSFTEMLSFITKAYPVVNDMAKMQKWDVCLVFFGIPSGPLGYYLKKKYRIPYVIRFGGGDIPGFQKRFTEIYQLIGPAIKLIWKNADALIANSEGLRRLAYDFYKKKEICIITNGTDAAYFKPANHENSRITILFVSRLIERKGLQYILPHLKEIQKKCEQEIQLVIVGDGPYRTALEEIAKRFQVEDMVSFEGQKDKKEIRSYYQNADLFILPSEKEGMPNVVLEAMAAGLPIIMTPCEGSEELINGNGFAVSVDEFTDKIALLCNKPELRKAYGNISRQNIVNDFSWDKIVDEYIEKICIVIEKRN